MSDFKSMQTRPGTKSSTKSKEDIKNSSFSLQVVSPSAGVPKSLDFHDLPVTTQVKDLKRLIRDTLRCRPPDELQRLIHHGRMLTRETETMSEIFGEEALRNSNLQIVHLVLRPGSENFDNSSTSDSIATHTPAKPLSMRHSQSQATEIPTESHPFTNYRQNSQTQPMVTSHQYQQQQNVLLQLEELQSLMGQRLLQLQRETQRLNQELHNMGVQASLRPNLIEIDQTEQVLPDQSTSLTQEFLPTDQTNKDSDLQNQTKISRVSQVLKKKDDPVAGSITQGSTICRSGQESLGHEKSNQRTFDRENMEPNIGEMQELTNEIVGSISNQSSQNHQRSLEQLNETTNNLRSILRNFNRPNNLNQQQDSHGLLSGNSESSRPRMFTSPAAPTFSTDPAVTSLPLGSKSKAGGESSETNFTTPSTLNNGKPLVYILSSPTGPRAILMSNTHYYFTPSRNTGRHRFNVGNSGQVGISSPIFLDRGRSARRQAREAQNRNGHPAEPRAAAPQANLRVGGIGIQFGQILWLIIRLAGFVWFFTAGNPSWSRWLVASGLAFFVFIILTGVLNGAVEQLWSPIRRHLETLVPLGPVHPPNTPLQQNRTPEMVRGEDRTQIRPQLDDGTQNIVDSTSELNNQEISDRSIERRARSNNGLFMTRIRRLEQSLILFIASLVPGVSERHIAHREAQANREMERQQQRMQLTSEQGSRVTSSENSIPEPLQDGENRRTNE